MKINKIELKNQKYFASGSQETPCYNADVYINGKKAIYVSNHGQGACDSQDVYPQFMGLHKDLSQMEILEKVNEYCIKTFGTETYKWGTIDIDLEHWSQREMFLRRDQSYLRRAMSKNVLYFKNKDGVEKGEYYSVKKQNNTSSLIAYIKDKYKECIVLNDLPFDDAVKTFRGAV